MYGSCTVPFCLGKFGVSGRILAAIVLVAAKWPRSGLWPQNGRDVAGMSRKLSETHAWGSGVSAQWSARSAFPARTF